ncbi:MAG: right-handed parallel beta-helix repeat-containing protein [Stackebrandtia sp.]
MRRRLPLVAVVSAAVLASAATVAGLTPGAPGAHADALLSDGFDYDSWPAGGWEASGCSEDEWSLSSSQLHYDGDSACASRNGSFGWTDYRLSAEVRRDDDSATAGIVFRHNDDDNHYALVLDGDGSLALRRTLSGSDDTLDSADADAQAGEFHTLAVEMRGGHISGFLDGEPLVEADDPEIGAGAVGLHAQQRASFDSVEVESLAGGYDAGLSEPFQEADPPSGQTLTLTDFGAVPDDPDEDVSLAFDAAYEQAAAGDEIYVPDGVYYVKSQISVKSGVSLRGQSTADTILRGTFGDDVPENERVVFKIASDDANLRMSTFTVDKDSDAPDIWEAIQIGNGDPFTGTASRFAVEGVDVSGFAKTGIAIRHASFVLLRDNKIHHATQQGGGGEGYAVMIAYDTSSNNIVRGNQIGPDIRHGVLAQYSAHHNLIEGNTVTGASQDAFDLHGEDEYANELRDNTARDCVTEYYDPDLGEIVESSPAGFGIGNTGSTHDASGPHNWLHHNKTHGCSYGATVILGSDQQYLEDNTFDGNTRDGIRVHDGGGAGLRLIRNTVSDNGAGIFLDSAVSAVVADNTVTGNSEIGVEVASASADYTVNGNDLTGNGTSYELSPDVKGFFNGNRT